MTKYSTMLTPDERIAAWRLGCYMKFAEAGIRPSQIEKVAAGPGAPLLSPSGLAKAVVTVAVLTGVPLGIAAHVVGQHVTASRGKEKELQAQTQYYRNAAQQLGSGLMAGG